MSTPSARTRLRNMRNFATRLRWSLESNGCHRVGELDNIITRQERQHRKGFGPRSYRASVPATADYFFIRCISWAMNHVKPTGEHSPSTGIIPVTSLDVRTDYLIALAIVARHGDHLHSAGFTATERAAAAELVDYSTDIAGN